MEPPRKLTTLPTEMFYEILTHMDLPSLAHLTRTSKLLQSLTSNHLRQRLLRDKSTLHILYYKGYSYYGSTLQWAVSKNRLQLVTELLENGLWEVDELVPEFDEEDALIHSQLGIDVDNHVRWINVCEHPALVLGVAMGNEGEKMVKLLLTKGAALTDEESKAKGLQLEYEDHPWTLAVSYKMVGILADEMLRRQGGRYRKKIAAKK